MRHLVIGASGQVGEQLVKKIIDNKEEVIGTFYKTPLLGLSNPQGISNKIPPGKNFTLDITRSEDVKKFIADIVPDVIYITSANTRVDYCEREPNQTKLINIGGVVNIINAVNEIEKKTNKSPLVIFFSTDYIFSGKSGPYNETEIPEPICEYGYQKLLSEHYVATNLKHFIIIRTTGVFGPETQEKNFVIRLVKNLRKDNKAIVSMDELGTPTYAPDLAEAIMKIRKNIGDSYRTHTSHVINIAGPKSVTRYQFACDVAKAFDCNLDLLVPVHSEEIDRSAKRPLKGGLSTNKLDSIIGRKLIRYQDGLNDMKSQMET